MSDDFMSQDEIDALLSGKDSGSAASEEVENSEEQLPKLEEAERDTLSEIGNISMGAAATALSTIINRKVKITVPSVYVSTPEALKESYPLPCIVVNVQYIKGLQGSNLLVIKERDAAIIGNLMMGEDGSNPPDEIDELYLSAVTEAMNMMMGSAATAMSDLFNYPIDISPPSAVQRNLSTDDLDTGESNEPVVTVAFRIEIENLVDSTMLQIIHYEFARNMVEQLLHPEQERPAESQNSELEAREIDDWDELIPEDDLTLEEQPTTEPNPVQTSAVEDQTGLGNIKLDLIRDIPVEIRTVLGQTRMSIDDILNLGPGHIMELDTVEGEPIDVYANDTLIARGEVVVVGEQFGIKITEISTPRDRIQSIR